MVRETGGKQGAETFSNWHWRLLGGMILILLQTVFLAALAHHFQVGVLALVMALLLPGLLTAALLVYWITFPFSQDFQALEIGLKSLGEGDSGFRLLPSQTKQADEAVKALNQFANQLSQERYGVYQKELLLDTVVQGVPMAVLLLDPGNRIVLTNQAANAIFQIGKPLTGLKLDHLVALGPPEFSDALASRQDAMFTLQRDDEGQTFFLSQRLFPMRSIPHRLLMIQDMTRELRRQEVATWKKLIRLINHELNNALAPIQSLLHSARKIMAETESSRQMDRIFTTLESTVQHLVKFLEGYARFVRLPQPRIEETDWRVFLDELGHLIPFRLENELNQPIAAFDPGQIQRVLINLIKNADEAAGVAGEAVIRLENDEAGGTALQVLDRGRGMSGEAMQKALLPFFSTKKSGTGLGLALCREIIESHGGAIRLAPREGGGLVVSVTLPPRQPDR